VASFGQHGCPLIPSKDQIQTHMIRFQTHVLGYPKTCVWKSVCKRMQYLNKCLLTSRITVIILLTLTLTFTLQFKNNLKFNWFNIPHTLLSPCKSSLLSTRGFCYNTRYSKVQFWKTSTAHLSLYWVLLQFEPLSKETSSLQLFGGRNWEDLSIAASSISQNCSWGCQCKVWLLLIKKQKLWKKHNTVNYTDYQLYACTCANETKENKNWLFTWSFCFCVYG